MRRLIIVLGLLLAGLTFVFSQDKVFLKNGSTIKGKYILSDSVKIVIRVYSDSLTIPWSSISNIKLNGKKESEIFQLDDVMEKGIFFGFKGGFLLSSSSDKFPISPSLEHYTGYRLNKWVSIAGKVGLDVYGEFATVPLGIKYFAFPVSSGRFSPVLLGDVGYGFVWMRDVVDSLGDMTMQGGINYSAGMGFAVLSNKGIFMISLVGKSQSVSQNFATPYWDGFSWNPIVERHRELRRMEVGVSYSFY